MPLPHEQAAIDAATGPRRQKLVAAAAVLDRLRAENPGLENIDDFPADVRDALRAAVRAFRPVARIGCGQLILVLLLAVGLGAHWLQPVHLYRCAPQGPGLAQCLVADRLFAVFPRRDQVVAGIAAAKGESHEVSEGRDRDGRLTSTRTEREELTLFDANGGKLWSVVEDNMVAIVSGQRKEATLRIQAFWPVLLVSSLFLVMGVSGLVSQIGLMLLDRDLIPHGMWKVVFGWGSFLLSVALCGLAWTVALLGDNPPALVAKLVGLG